MSFPAFLLPCSKMTDNNELIGRQTEFFPAGYILTFVEYALEWRARNR